MDEAKRDAEESWSGVESAANETEATLIVGFLESQNIPARIVDRSFHEMPTMGEDLSSVEVAVPSDRLEEAREVLAKREVAFEASPEGSEAVLTDEGPAEIDVASQAEPEPAAETEPSPPPSVKPPGSR